MVDEVSWLLSGLLLGGMVVEPEVFALEGFTPQPKKPSKRTFPLYHYNHARY